MPFARSDAADAYLERVLALYERCKKGEDEQRAKQLDDYKFSIGDGNQWDGADRALRGNRPMLENNRLNQFVRQIVNDMLAAKPDVQVNGVDDEADPDTAEVLQAILRDISTKSDADIAYMLAAEWQIRAGVGYVRVLAEYDDDRSGNQRLRIKAIPNRFSVYDDPAAIVGPGADRSILFITEDIPEEDFPARFPTSEVAGRLNEFQALGDTPADWFTKGHIRIAEVFTRRMERSIITLPNGTTRELTTPIVEWAVINGLEILDGNPEKTGPRRLPIPWIPVSRAVGEAFYPDGKVDYRGITRIAKHPQKFSNYLDSATAEALALAPKAPFIGYRPVFENHPEWDSANLYNYSKLEAEAAVGPNGQLLPLPVRQTAEPPIRAMALMAQRADNNLRAVIGYVDVQEQERRHEQSGVAIDRRRQQAELGNSHFQHNFGKMIEHVGRILVEWIPHVYDAPRVLRLLGADDKQRSVMVHAGMPPPELAQGMSPKALAQQRGVEGIYDLGAGRYDTTISTGPAFQTRRQEAFQALSGLMEAAPELMIPLASDLFFEYMDTPVSRQLAARAKKQFGHDEEQQGPPPIPPQIQQQMAAMLEQVQRLQAELAEKTQLLETKRLELQQQAALKQAEFALKREDAEREAALEREKAQLEMETQIALARIKVEAARELAVIAAESEVARAAAAPTGSSNGEVGA